MVSELHQFGDQNENGKGHQFFGENYVQFSLWFYGLNPACALVSQKNPAM